MTPKTFANLAIAAIATLAVALVLYTAAQPWSKAAAGGPLFATLNRDAAAVERISISQGDARLTINKAGERWVVKERNDFPASTEKVRSMLLALSEANLAEPKTRRPASFNILELEDPKSNAYARILECAEQALVRDRSGAIVLGCAGMADMCRTLQQRLGVPVIDGVAAAVKLAEALVSLGLGTSKRGDYAAPLAKDYAGLAAPYSPH